MSGVEDDERLGESKKDNAGIACAGYTRRKSVAVIVATKQDITTDKTGDKKEDDQTSVTSLPTFCGPFEVKHAGRISYFELQQCIHTL